MKLIEQDNVQACSSMFKPPSATSIRPSAFGHRWEVADAEGRSGRGRSHDPGHYGHRWHDGDLLLRGFHFGRLLAR